MSNHERGENQGADGEPKTGSTDSSDIFTEIIGREWKERPVRPEEIVDPLISDILRLIEEETLRLSKSRASSVEIERAQSELAGMIVWRNLDEELIRFAGKIRPLYDEPDICEALKSYSEGSEEDGGFVSQVEVDDISPYCTTSEIELEVCGVTAYVRNPDEYGEEETVLGLGLCLPGDEERLFWITLDDVASATCDVMSPELAELVVRKFLPNVYERINELIEFDGSEESVLEGLKKLEIQVTEADADNAQIDLEVLLDFVNTYVAHVINFDDAPYIVITAATDDDSEGEQLIVHDLSVSRVLQETAGEERDAQVWGFMLAGRIPLPKKHDGYTVVKIPAAAISSFKSTRGHESAFSVGDFFAAGYSPHPYTSSRGGIGSSAFTLAEQQTEPGDTDESLRELSGAPADESDLDFRYKNLLDLETRAHSMFETLRELSNIMQPDERESKLIGDEMVRIYRELLGSLSACGGVISIGGSGVYMTDVIFKTDRPEDGIQFRQGPLRQLDIGQELRGKLSDRLNIAPEQVAGEGVRTRLRANFAPALQSNYNNVYPDTGLEIFRVSLQPMAIIDFSEDLTVTIPELEDIRLQLQTLEKLINQNGQTNLLMSLKDMLYTINWVRYDESTMSIDVSVLKEVAGLAMESSDETYLDMLSAIFRPDTSLSVSMSIYGEDGDISERTTRGSILSVVSASPVAPTTGPCIVLVSSENNVSYIPVLDITALSL